MRAYENLVKAIEPQHIDRIAGAALELYGLTGADVESVGSGTNMLFQVNVPSASGKAFHPYLGRIDGKRFLLQVRDAGPEGELSMYSEVAWLAELLRETDLCCPEPVPAWDGSLVAEVSLDEAGCRRQQCVLFRWFDGEQSLHIEMLGANHGTPATNHYCGQWETLNHAARLISKNHANC